MKTLDCNFSLLGLSETRLQNQTCDLYDLEGYEFVETHRTTKSGGGVGLFINDKYQFYKRADLFQLDDCMECVSIEIEKHKFEGDKNIIVSVIYRPPNTDTDVFINTLNTFIEKIKPENNYCYLLGYYNINILNYATQSATANFVDSLFSYGFLPLISRPTRVTTSFATLIDNIFTNKFNHSIASSQGILVTDTRTMTMTMKRFYCHEVT